VKTHVLPIYAESVVDRIAKEVAFIDLFRQLQHRHDWLRQDIYAVGGAANYSLLYVLARSLLEHDCKQILELGAGQTSQILSGYAAKFGSRVISLEQERMWVENVSKKCSAPSHQIVHAPIEHKKGFDAWYEISLLMPLVPANGFDLVLVDGPVGSARQSRIGIVDVFFDVCADEWLLIWDDLHRSADLESFVYFLKTARKRQAVFDFAFCTGVKTVGLAFTARFGDVKYYF